MSKFSPDESLQWGICPDCKHDYTHLINTDVAECITPPTRRELGDAIMNNALTPGRHTCEHCGGTVPVV